MLNLLAPLLWARGRAPIAGIDGAMAGSLPVAPSAAERAASASTVFAFVVRISPKRSVGGYREESDRFFAALVFPAKTHFVKAKKALAMLSKNSG